MGDARTLIKHFKSIEIEKPSEIIINQIRELIGSGVLKPGDKLPSERSLSERMGISRGYVREALQRLEFYGILKTLPQKGTVVSSLGVRALEGLISNVLRLEKDDFASLMETRALLETHAARLAAERRTEAEYEELERIFEEFRKRIQRGEPGLDEDLLFHLKIAELCRNSVLMSLVSLMTPDILRMSMDQRTCDDEHSLEALGEHEAVLKAIKDRDGERAADAMGLHMTKTRALDKAASVRP